MVFPFGLLHFVRHVPALLHERVAGLLGQLGQFFEDAFRVLLRGLDLRLRGPDLISQLRQLTSRSLRALLRLPELLL